MKVNWKHSKIGIIAGLSTGTTPPSEKVEYFGGYLKWFTPQDVNDTLYLHTSHRTLTTMAIIEKKARLFPKGTILMTAIGNIGRVGILEEESSANQQITGITLTTDEVDVEFVFFWLLAHRSEILQRASQSVIPIINQEKIKQIPISYPSIDEQHHIVARIKECMERVEEIETLRKECLEEAKGLAPSLYVAMENGDQWPTMTIGELITQSRNGRSIRQDNENATGFVLSLSAVHDISLNLDERKPINLPYNIAIQYKISTGDVFVSRSNTRELVGLSSVATESPMNVIYPDLLIKLEPKPELIRPRFLSYALRTPESRKQIKDRAFGTSQSMVKISGQRLKEVEIPVPPLEVQDALIERFDELHDLSFNLMSNLRFLNSGALRQSILRKAFAGEL